MNEVKIGRQAVYEDIVQRCQSDGAHLEGLYGIYELVEECEVEIEDGEDEELVEAEPYEHIISKKIGLHIYQITR